MTNKHKIGTRGFDASENTDRTNDNSDTTILNVPGVGDGVGNGVGDGVGAGVGAI